MENREEVYSKQEKDFKNEYSHHRYIIIRRLLSLLTISKLTHYITCGIVYGSHELIHV